ncbi:MAG: hypothetical protein PVH68_13090 [Armatimonadota bacterium]|jgi:hypothetical protein
MMRTDRRTLIVGLSVLAIVACSAALGVHFIGREKHGAQLVKPIRDPAAAATSERLEATVEPSLEHYFVVTERNVFSPLLSEPRENVALAVPMDMPSATGTSRVPSTPPRRDPTADLAMTGVVESNAGLMALIKDIRRDVSVYAGVGDEAFGLRVASIEAKRAILAQADETYTIELGAKKVPDEGAEARATPSRPSGTAASAGTAEGGPGPGFRRPGFGPGGMSREEMMRRFGGRFGGRGSGGSSGMRGGFGGRGPGGGDRRGPGGGRGR